MAILLLMCIGIVKKELAMTIYCSLMQGVSLFVVPACGDGG